MSEGRRLRNFVATLHERLASARTNARNDAPTVEDLLKKKAESEPADETPQTRESASTEGESTRDEESKVFHLGPPEEGKTADTVDAGPFGHDEKETSAPCSACGRIIDLNGTEQNQPHLCRECRAVKSGPPLPVSEWREASLGEMSQAILQVLQTAYPEKLSASEIVEQLEGRDFLGTEIGKSLVNSKLYGRLHEWLEKEGRTPPYWSLKRAEEESGEEHPPPDSSDTSDEAERCTSCGEPVEEWKFVGDSGLLCEDCASRKWDAGSERSDVESGSASRGKRDQPGDGHEPSDRVDQGKDATEESATGGVLNRPGETVHLPGQKAEHPASDENVEGAGTNYELCYMCIKEFPEEDLTRANGLRLCPGCLESVESRG